MTTICIEYLQQNIPDIIQSICRHLSSLAYIKWYNNKYDLSINFDVLHLSSVYTCKEVSISDWLNEIYRNPANAQVKQIKEANIVQYIQDNPCSDPLLLINGHDLCDCISVWLKKHSPSCTNINKDKISHDIRLCYRFDDFQKTRMYSAINAWRQTHCHELFIPRNTYHPD